MHHQNLISAAKKYGTPLYLYDGDLIEAKYNQLKSCFPPPFILYYVMKANPLAGIARLFLKDHAGVEVCSSGELFIALKAGFSPGALLFSGPGKTRAELEYATRENIGCIAVESCTEILLIDKLSRDWGKITPVALRINPDWEPAGAAIPYAGKASQFGIDTAAVPELVNTAKKLPGVKLTGIQIYCGTQAVKAENILHNMQAALELAVQLAGATGLPLDFLSLGPGLGVPYTVQQKPLDLQVLSGGARELRENYREKLPAARVAIASGRFLTAEAGCFIVRILYRKKCKGKEYLVCDGGINLHNKTPYLGRFPRFEFPAELAGKAPGNCLFQATGPLCTPLDVIGQDLPLSEPAAGDILILRNTGAYGYTESPGLFLSHPAPPEILLYKEQEYILKTRGKPEDLIRNQTGTVAC